MRRALAAQQGPNLSAGHTSERRARVLDPALRLRGFEGRSHSGPLVRVYKG